ncbi:LacI family DNA-binding transcriptional regulator [Ravibacter arvi]|uniref:LacI family DNA-binding transcriptional regulator n=1 Tax=Ravibacter arvi TaxID=2051041 RepID=UPI0031EAFB93
MRQKKDHPLAGVKEIARRANVSRGTVDRVIHNRPGVSEETKRHINAIIEELDYQPNVLARRLALASRGTVRLGVLLPSVSEETEYWKAPLEGIDKAETEIKPYGVELKHYFFDQNVQATFARQVAQIMVDQPDGVLITPTFEEESIQLLGFCREKQIPAVLMNSDIPGQQRLCYIGPELFDSGYLAAQLTDYCLKPGQKVMVVNIAREIENNVAILGKVEGFLAYFREKRSEEPLVHFHTTDTDYVSVSAGLSALLAREKEIGIIFVTNSRVVLVAEWLEKTGRKDIVLIGYDFLSSNIDYLKKGYIDFLICEKPQEQGYRGVMTLFRHLVMSVPAIEDYLIPIDIVTSANYRFYRN